MRNSKSPLLKNRPHAWEIIWNDGYFWIHINFQRHDPYSINFTLSYYDWKMLVSQIMNVVYERHRHRNGRALSELGKHGIHYLPLKSTEVETQATSRQVKEWLATQVLRISPVDKRTGVKDHVTISFQQSSIRLSRKAYTQFESDLLDADYKLDRLLGRPPQVLKLRRQIEKIKKLRKK